MLGPYWPLTPTVLQYRPVKCIQGRLKGPTRSNPCAGLFCCSKTDREDDVYANPWLESVTRVIIEPSMGEARQTITVAVATVSGVVLAVSAALARKVARSYRRPEGHR